MPPALAVHATPAPTAQPAPEKAAAAAAIAPAAFGRWNRLVGWWSIAVSLAGGSLLGLWAFGGPFTPPAWFGSYDDPGRRLLRLAHIAAVMLPILNFHFLRALPAAACRPVTAGRACALLLAGSVGLPLALVLAAAWRPGLYLLPLPVTAVLLPIVLLAAGLTRATLRPTVSVPPTPLENEACVSD